MQSEWGRALWKRRHSDGASQDCRAVPWQNEGHFILFLQLEMTGERQAQGLESETRQGGAYFGSLEWLPVQVASFWS